MTDQFLIKFALSTLVVLSFVGQHVSQIIYRRMDTKGPREKLVSQVACIVVIQLISIAIIMEIMRYALNK